MTMLEKIAEAIGEADVCGDLHEAGYMNLARAALTAMMELPESMYDGVSDPWDGLSSFTVKCVWEDLVQAILNEGAEK